MTSKDELLDAARRLRAADDKAGALRHYLDALQRWPGDYELNLEVASCFQHER